MKRALISSLLVMAAFAAGNKSYSQGSLLFVNYSFGIAQYSAPVTYGGYLDLGSNYTAQLLYSATGAPGSYALVAGAASQFYASDGDTGDGAGFFGAMVVTIPSYTSGNAYFEVEVYNNIPLQYDVGWYPYPIFVPAGEPLALSQPFEYSALATAANSPSFADPFPDNPNVVIPLEPFGIYLIPEPSIITLSMLGLANLLVFRYRGSHRGSAAVASSFAATSRSLR